MKDYFDTVKDQSSAEIKIQRSKFIANAYQVSTKQDVEVRISEIRKTYFDAAHHPYAYILQTGEKRFSDDGEPTGTAGAPINEVINKFNVTDVLIIVTRYFGGVKLGTGGLRRAISEVSEAAMKKAAIQRIYLYRSIVIEGEYKYISDIMRIIDGKNVILEADESLSALKVSLKIRLSKISEIVQAISNVSNNTLTINEA